MAMTANEILEEIKALGSDSYKRVMFNHGVKEPYFGVKISELQKIVMRIRKDYQLALDLYEKEPTNAVYASTYAFALYNRGEAAKAAKILGELTDQQLRQPTISVYYGIILAAVGDRGRAAEFLALAEKASLLPEERALVEKAKRSLAQG